VARRVPARLLADAHEAKKIVKRAVAPWLPAHVLERPKQGFAMPLERWLRDGLAASLTDRATRGPVAELIDPRFIRRVADDHARGADRTAIVHSIVFLDHWLERWA